MGGLLILTVFLALPVLALTALVDAMRRPGWAYKAAHRSKAITIVGLLLTYGVGAPFYWLYFRRLIVRAERSAAPPRERPTYDPWADDA